MILRYQFYHPFTSGLVVEGVLDIVTGGWRAVVPGHLKVNTDFLEDTFFPLINTNSALNLKAGDLIVLHVGGALVPIPECNNGAHVYISMCAGGGTSPFCEYTGDELCNLSSVGVPPVTLTSAGPITGNLPVSWLYFTAETNNGTTVLKWATETERNNRFFAIERSTNNGSDFEEIGQVRGGGDRSQATYYTFVTTTATTTTTVFYRLRQVDFSGEFNYSNVVAVVPTADSVDTLYTVSPNPATAGSMIVVPEGTTIKLFSVTGEQITTTTGENFHAPATGIYFIKITPKGGGEIVTQKFVVTN